jgi:hypothetical protein
MLGRPVVAVVARQVASVPAVAVHHPDLVVLVDAVPRVAVGDQAAVGREAGVELWSGAVVRRRSPEPSARATRTSCKSARCRRSSPRAAAKDGGRAGPTLRRRPARRRDRPRQLLLHRPIQKAARPVVVRLRTNEVPAGHLPARPLESRRQRALEPAVHRVAQPGVLHERAGPINRPYPSHDARPTPRRSATAWGGDADEMLTQLPAADAHRVGARR